MLPYLHMALQTSHRCLEVAAGMKTWNVWNDWNKCSFYYCLVYSASRETNSFLWRWGGVRGSLMLEYIRVSGEKYWTSCTVRKWLICGQQMVGWPPAHHLGYRTPTTHQILPNFHNLPTTYWPPTNHLLYQTPTDHQLTTYWPVPPTKYLPNTYQTPTNYCTYQPLF